MTDQRERPVPIDDDNFRSGARGAGTVWSDIGLGMSLTVGGGRSAWTRLTLTAFGVGLCVLVLLLAASVGPAIGSRDDRAQAMNPVLVDPSVRGPGQFEVNASEQSYRDQLIVGMDLAVVTPGTADDPVAIPPGLRAFPGPGELVISPALADLLASADGAELRPRFEGQVVGRIGSAGLLSPDELRFYRGSTPTTAPLSWNQLATGWGAELASDPVDEYITVLLTAGTTIVIVPLLIFVSLMSRLGAPGRDRRSAAIRLLGASAGQLRRITLTETALAAIAGLFLGTVAFLCARYAAPWLKVGVSGFYPADITPQPIFALLIALGVPVLAIAAVWAGTRQIVVEPLGVVRSTRTAPRRLGWRLLVLFVGGVAMLGSITSGVLIGDRLQSIVMSLAIVALLTSVPILLPWVLERLAGRLPTGGTSWLLAVRRLQLDSGLPSRVVAGISVVLAGAIALQTLLAAGLASYSSQQYLGKNMFSTDTTLVTVQQATGADLTEVVDTLDGAYSFVSLGGVEVTGTALSTAAGNDELSPGDNWFQAVITPCAAIPVPAAECRDGDVFNVAVDPAVGRFGDQAAVAAGSTLRFPQPDGSDVRWTVPALAGTVQPANGEDVVDPYLNPTLIITPGALSVDRVAPGANLVMLVRPAPGTSGTTADTIHAALGDLTWRVSVVSASDALSADSRGALATTARTGLLLGAGLTLLVAAVGLLVMAVEQLHERRRSLTLTVASGVPRSVIARSLLIGAAIPMVVGVVLAVAIGGALGLFLLEVVGRQGGLDWGIVGGYSAAAVLVVVLVTLATLPAVARLTRPDALRTS